MQSLAQKVLQPQNSHKILLIFDKFKDTLPSAQICQIVREKLQQFEQQNLKPENKYLLINEVPVSDGGDGFVNCMFQVLRNNRISPKIKHLDDLGGSYTLDDRRCSIQLLKTNILDPLMRQKQTEYLLDQENQTAYIEVANSSGLQMLSLDERDPFKASSIGTGMLIKHCYEEHQVKRIVIGSGGSAFVDGGIGAMIGLGIYKLNQDLNVDYNKLQNVLEHLVHDEALHQKLSDDLEFILPCDVQNPMLGINGAAFVFGPQKGAKPEDLLILDQRMEQTMKFYLQNRYKAEYNDEQLHNIANIPGTGAAGGLVAALISNFNNVQVVNGMNYLSTLIDLETQIKDSSVVFTGEGSFDSQTLEGKVVCKINELCQKHQKPMIIICGINKLNQTEINLLLTTNPKLQVYDLVSNYGLEKSLKQTANCLAQLTENSVIPNIQQYIY
eukprot:403355056